MEDKCMLIEQVRCTVSHHMSINAIMSFLHFLQGKKLDKLCIIILSEMAGKLANKDNLVMNE